MTSSPWLDETEAAAWRGLWAMSHLVFDRVGRELQQRCGLSLLEYDILVSLAAADGSGIRLRDLATQTLSSRARLSYHIKGMVERGLIRREDCVSDRRGAIAVLTREGHAVLERAAPGHVADVRRVLIDALDDEDLRHLGSIADRLAAHLAPEDGSAGSDRPASSSTPSSPPATS